MLLGAFHSKPVPQTSFYWPLRYTLGGNYLLRGYPYFTQKGGQLGYANVSLYVPLWQTMGKQVLNVYFSKMYLQLYAEVGRAWDTPLSDLKADDFKPDNIWDIYKGEVKKDVGIQLSLESYLYYLIPYNINFSVTFPLDKVNHEELSPRYHLYFSYE
jgi:hypothetical protein